VLSSRGLCDELITRTEEFYLLWRVVLCDLETSKEEAKRPLKDCEYKPKMGCDAERKKNEISLYYDARSKKHQNTMYAFFKSIALIAFAANLISMIHCPTTS
jgi:hypothetical protein